MGYELWHKISQLARGVMPFLLSTLLMLMMLSSTGIPGFVQIAPSMTIISVYFWSINRPDLMPLWAIFVLGLIEDALPGGPFGIQAIVLVLVASFVSSQRHFFSLAPFSYLLSTFLLVVVCALGLNWVLNCIVSWELWDARTLLVKAAITVICYSPVYWLLDKVDQAVVSVR